MSHERSISADSSLYLQMQRRGYAEVHRREAKERVEGRSLEARMAFDRLMSVSLLHAKPRPQSGLVEWYRRLLRRRK